MAEEHAPALRVEVLGPLRLVVDGAAVDVRGPKRRALLAMLALAEGRTVPVDHLLDTLWPAEIPESGRQALHTQVSRLRAHLGPAAPRLHARQDGYLLELDELDVARARSLLATARGPDALALLRQAHTLWRGPVLADLTDVAPIATAAEGCARLRSEVTDALVDAAVEAGEAAGVVGLAADSLAADPLREPAVLLLMRALAAAGRAPEALRAGRDHRRRLTEETGLDPSPALGELERAIAGGAAGPPPHRSPAPARPATRLIGREAQVAAIHRLLAAERLVTVVGPGGVGKTRVALEVASPGDAPTVLLLAPVTAAAAIPHALASALRLSVVAGDVLTACVAVLGDDPGLLVIDNCEHLLDAVRDTVGVLLAGCPRLTILATSREPLGLADEYTFRLAPLPLPRESQVDDRPDDLPGVPSVAVFLDRAARVRPIGDGAPADLRLVADIVRRLDGMPLAIELAAGRLSTFSLDDLHARLDRSLDLLGGGRPAADARHRTLRATVEWSYRLLSAAEQRLFRHLSVFVDGVDLATAERLAAELAPDTDPGAALSRLVDASVIDASFDGGTRYRMLETLRAFGLDRLAAAGEQAAAAAALVRWAVELASRFEQAVATDREPEADALVRRELPNLRAAWRLTRDRGRLDDAVALVIWLFDAITYRDLVELRDWALELAEDPSITAHPRAGRVLGTAAEAAYHRGDLRRAARFAEAGLALAADPRDRWPCLMAQSVVALARGEFAEVVSLSEAAAPLAGRPRENLGVAALALAYGGDLDGARQANRRGLDGAVSPTMLAWGAYVDGEIDSLAGRDEVAEEHYERAVELARGSGATFLVGVATVGLLAVRAAGGRVHDALRGYREVIDYFARTGNWTHQWTTLRNLANLLRRLDDHDTATLLDTAADHAPDAPAVEPHRMPPPEPRPVPGRAAVLTLARQAIDRCLTTV